MKYEVLKELYAEFDVLLKSALTEASASRAVEIIRIIGVQDSDDERAHIMEDQLRAAYIAGVAAVAKIVMSTDRIDFERWYA